MMKRKKLRLRGFSSTRRISGKTFLVTDLLPVLLPAIQFFSNDWTSDLLMTYLGTP